MSLSQSLKGNFKDKRFAVTHEKYETTMAFTVGKKLPCNG